MQRSISTAFLVAMTLAVHGAAHAQDIDAGEKLFKQRCQSCHAITPGKVTAAGPNLLGVVGRVSGSTDFKYSAAMKKAAITWDAANMDKFLTAPAKLIPGTRMAIMVPKQEQRAALIEYLSSLKN